MIQMAVTGHYHNPQPLPDNMHGHTSNCLQKTNKSGLITAV
jgi:hypothetical protein